MDAEEEIRARRTEIDRLDDLLLRLLNQRAQLGTELLRLKRAAGLPICDPARELEVICRARESNAGPLEDEAVENIFRRIVHETRRAEEQENARAGAEGALP
ncbi:MAG: chorismate mutase [Candidatus Angelobacter sp.]|nr:chorismate mutase [Candidatus Angelobacter sp.]